MRTLVAQVALLPMLVFAFFVAWTHSFPTANAMLPAVSDVGRTWFIAFVVLEAIAMATVWGLIFALPIAFLYKRFSLVAAALCVLPVLLVIVDSFSLSLSLGANIPVAAFILSLAVIVPLIAHATYRWLRLRRMLVA